MHIATWLRLHDGTERTFLKALLTERPLYVKCHCTLPPHPPPSYLPFPSCLVALCFVLASQPPLFDSIKWHIYPTLWFLTSVLISTNEMWDKRRLFIWLHLTWRFTCLSKARCFNSIIALSNMLPLPALLVEMMCFYITGEDRRAGNEPIPIIHRSSTFPDHLIVFQSTENRENTAKDLYILRPKDRARFLAAFKVDIYCRFVYMCVYTYITT